MGKLGYTLRRLKHMRINAALDTVKRVSLRCGKPQALVLLDIAWCGLRYSAGYMDYDVFQMERTNAKQRKTFITRGVNNNFVKSLNDVNYRHYFKNKDEFNTAFADFIGRKWMLIEAGKSKEFAAWLNGREVVIAKPRAGMCGKGIQKLYTKDFAGTAELFDYLLNSNCELVEECLTQHGHLNEMYPDSINTTRIITVFKDGKAKVICAYLRIGNCGRHVDNFNSGGMITRVNLDTGKLMFDAVDKAGITYSSHPITSTVIKDY
ncbi:MAG: sugar-transfer associated ATP-grasp domain-containing protein, partial [Eubacteriales bacterium]